MSKKKHSYLFLCNVTHWAFKIGFAKKSLIRLLPDISLGKQEFSYEWTSYIVKVMTSSVLSIVATDNLDIKMGVDTISFLGDNHQMFVVGGGKLL